MMQPTSKPTIRDIAAAAGVSLATVSYALTGKKGVSEKTRQHVLQIAAKMGYLKSVAVRPSPIAVIYPVEEGTGASYVAAHRVYSLYAKGVQRAAADEPGLSVVYAPNDTSNFAFRQVWEDDLYGMIFFGTEAGDRSVREAVARGTPVVLLNHAGTSDVSSVSVANRQAMRALVSHLITCHDCRTLAFVQSEEPPTYSIERLAGCIDALERHGLPAEHLTVYRFSKSMGVAEDRVPSSGVN